MKKLMLMMSIFLLNISSLNEIMLTVSAIISARIMQRIVNVFSVG